MFDDLSSEELAAASTKAADAGLSAARLVAAQHLVTGPAAGVARPAAVAALLMDRDATDPRWERVGPYERSWALLVLRIVAPVMNPVGAVGDARRRGVTWAAIAESLGVTAQAAQQRYARATRTF